MHYQNQWIFSEYPHSTLLVTDLNETNTANARSACSPNTFLKNSAATVTPEFCICSFVAALSQPEASWTQVNITETVHSREIRDIR